MFEEYVQPVLDFVKANEAWAPFIVGVLTFLESMAVISFFVPAFGMLIGIGALLGVSGISFWPVWVGAVVGACLGDWLSYAVGSYFKDRLHHMWPLSRYPEFTKRADDFMTHWGAWGVFIGRFSGPLRAFVPLAAGVFGVPQLRFQLANVTSAMVWAFVLLLPGGLIGPVWDGLKKFVQ
jgi:membrane protein DedA with SNARE-associated domain